ncbi:MAG: tetraacyldisaccharide 4'-kinase [Verrucomicrobiota bacterium]
MAKFAERLEEFAVDVILERRYGKRAALLRLLLYGLSGVYRRLVQLRVRAYEERLGDVRTLGCQVISVGNLTVGGTGKTPVVEKFARALTAGGRKVAILSRGYKSQPRPLHERWADRFKPLEERTPPRVVSDGRSLLLDSTLAGDEPYMLAKNLEDVVVLVDKDRVKSGLYAIKEFGCDTLLLDDGLQYLRLKERLDIVLVDREAPWGNRYLLPRGTLREPREHLKRAHYIFITKCDGSDLSGLKADLRQYNQHAEFIECRHAPLRLENLYTREIMDLEFLKELRIGAISGIARPESFEDGLKRLGADIAYTRRFADHHRFSSDELSNMFQRTKMRGGKCIVTTEKDAVRFPAMESPPLPVYFLRVEIKILSGDETFAECVQRLCNIHATEQEIRQLATTW